MVFQFECTVWVYQSHIYIKCTTAKKTTALYLGKWNIHVNVAQPLDSP